MPERRVLVKSELKEWLESPVAETVKEALKASLEAAYQERADVFISGDAHKTQEIRATLLGVERTYQDIINVFELDPESLNVMFDANNIEVIKTKQEEDEEENNGD